MTTPTTPFSGPEEKFIVACLTRELHHQPVILPPADGMDWEKVASLLEKNRLAAHFYSLGHQSPGFFPDGLREHLRQARYANLLYGDRCRLEIKAVLGALKNAGIPVMVMKGWALIQWLYGGDHGQRYCEDIDILVSPDRLNQAEAVLRSLNYAGADEVSPGYTRRFSNARAYLLAGGPRRFSIGLHWGLTHYPYFDEKRTNIAELFERAHPLRVADTEVLELAHADQLIYTCAHLALHHRNEETLLNYFEIAAIIQRAGAQLDWQTVVERSVAWRYLVQVQFVLGQVYRFWPGVIPGEAFEHINQPRPAWMEQMLDRLVANTKGNEFKSALLELLSMPGLANKFSSIYHQLFPDRAYMLARYGAAAHQGLIKLYAVRLGRALGGLFQNKAR